MSSSEIILPPRKSVRPSWPVALSFLTALVTVGTVTLHLIGVIRHRTHLGYWGIDADLFPKATDWILINGYFGLFDRFFAILGAIFANLHWLLTAGIVLGLYVFILVTPVGGGTGKFPNWLRRQPEWRQRLFKHVVLTTLVVGIAPLALFMLTAFMAVPAALGEQAGKAAAEANALEYEKGCEKSRYTCVQLRKNGQLVATGFVLDDSPAQIAIFDTQLQRGRTLPRDGLEMISTRAPKIGLAEASDKTSPK